MWWLHYLGLRINEDETKNMTVSGSQLKGADMANTALGTTDWK